MDAEHIERLEAHPQAPTAKFAKFQAALEAHALRTANERAERDRERRDATVYHHNQEQHPSGGTSANSASH